MPARITCFLNISSSFNWRRSVHWFKKVFFLSKTSAKELKIKMNDAASTYIIYTFPSPFSVIMNILSPCWQVSLNPFGPGCCMITSVPLSFTLAMLFWRVMFWSFNIHTVLDCGPSPLNRQAKQRADWLVTSISDLLNLYTFFGIHKGSGKKRWLFL